MTFTLKLDPDIAKMYQKICDKSLHRQSDKHLDTHFLVIN